MTALEDKLAGWTGPSSATEQDKQDRTERMIREAIDAHPAFKGMSRSVYVKGSYANNTNVKSDSDVDVAVECEDVAYWGEAYEGAHPEGTPYKGEWTPAKLRTEMIAALQAKFGSDVDTSGTTAIHVNSSSARVEADVVPCFNYRYYLSPTSYREGAKVFRTTGGTVINYAERQLENGRAKNNRTNQAYKKTVRIIKRLENAMNDAGVHGEVPSYFLECLVYRCPDSMFMHGSWTEVVQDVLAHIHNSLQGPEPTEESDRWLEVNEAKFLFGTHQKWSRADARAFAFAAYNYLGFGK